MVIECLQNLLTFRLQVRCIWPNGPSWFLYLCTNHFSTKMVLTLFCMWTYKTFGGEAEATINTFGFTFLNYILLLCHCWLYKEYCCLFYFYFHFLLTYAYLSRTKCLNLKKTLKHNGPSTDTANNHVFGSSTIVF